MVTYHIEMSKDAEFVQTVAAVAGEVDEIIETGCFAGTGSTLVFARTGKPVISVECNPQFVAIARQNLRDFPNVKIMHAHSLSVSAMRQFIASDLIYDMGLPIEYEGGQDARDFYLREVSTASGAQDVLWGLINNDKRQIVLLDSAGGVGYLEFLRFMELPPEFKARKILFLDDINHVKHYRSVIHLESLKLPFKRGSSGRWGWVRFPAVGQ